MHSGRYKCMKTSHGYVNQTNQTRQVFFLTFAVWRIRWENGGEGSCFLVGGNGQRQRDHVDHWFLNVLYLVKCTTFTSREESRIWGRGWGLKRQQGVWCCLKGISGFKDPIPPPSIPEEFLNTKDFVLRAAAGWDYQVEHLQCILIFKWIFMNPIFRWTMGFFIPPISPLSYHLSCKRSWPAVLRYGTWNANVHLTRAYQNEGGGVTLVGE